MKTKVLFFLLLLFLTGCRKKDVNIEEEPEVVKNIIKPGSYFPVYPGSWWKYLKSDGDTVIHQVAPDYMKNSYSTRGITPYQSPEFYVPFYDNIPVWGARMNRIIAHGYHPLVMEVSDSLAVGSQWTYKCINSHDYEYAKVVQKDATIVIDGKSYYPTIVVEYSTSLQDGKFKFMSGRRYYTKDIGIVRFESADSSTFENLVAYSVKK